jgi:hypothetical protein
VQAYGDLLLLLVEPIFRETLGSLADHSAAQEAQSLGALEPLARAELTLRNLAILTLEVASQTFEPSSRLPRWARTIQEARAAHEEAVDFLAQTRRRLGDPEAT